MFCTDGQRLTFRVIGSRKTSLCFGFGKFGLENKVSVSETLVSEKKFRLRKIWYRKKVSVLVSVKIKVSSFSADGLEIDQEDVRGADRGAGNVTTGGTTAPRVGTDSC